MAWDDKAKQGESGLADDYILVTGTENRFGFPFENAPEVCVLILEGARIIDGEEDEGREWLSVGDFEPGDKEGSFALHSSQNPDKQFNSSTKAMKFIKSALAAGVPLEDLQKSDRAQYESKDARIWDNLALRIHVEPTEPVKLKDGTMSKPGRQPLVTEYLGTREEFYGKGGAKAAVSSGASATISGGSDGSDGLDSKLTILAKASGDHLTFLEKAVELGVDPSDPRVSEESYSAAKA